MLLAVIWARTAVGSNAALAGDPRVGFALAAQASLYDSGQRLVAQTTQIQAVRGTVT